MARLNNWNPLKQALQEQYKKVSATHIENTDENGDPWLKYQSITGQTREQFNNELFRTNINRK